MSEGVYGRSSVASVAIAAHECGHVMQHETGYIPLKIRGALVPVANFGSNAGIWIVMLSLFFGLSIELVDLGIFLFSFGVLFQLVTLPVEFNASKRGLVLLQNLGITEWRNEKCEESSASGCSHLCCGSSIFYSAAASAYNTQK